MHIRLRRAARIFAASGYRAKKLFLDVGTL
jgi:hypothetical protein